MAPGSAAAGDVAMVAARQRYSHLAARAKSFSRVWFQAGSRHGRGRRRRPVRTKASLGSAGTREGSGSGFEDLKQRISGRGRVRRGIACTEAHTSDASQADACIAMHADDSSPTHTLYTHLHTNQHPHPQHTTNTANVSVLPVGSRHTRDRRISETTCSATQARTDQAASFSLRTADERRRSRLLIQACHHPAKQRIF